MESAFCASPLLDALLERWRAAFNQRDAAAMARLFADDVLFQGLTPNLIVGRAAVCQYYENVPAGVDVKVEPAKAVCVASGLIAGFATVLFSHPEQSLPQPVRLSITAQHTAAGWQIRLYHASVSP